MLAPDRALATLPITIYVLGLWIGTLPIGWLARHYGRRTAFQIGTISGVVTGLLCCIGVVTGIVPDFLRRRLLLRSLRRRASGLSLRRRRYGERSVQAESDFLGAARRRVRRRRRSAAHHPDQGYVAAVSVRRELYRPVAGRGAGGGRAVTRQYSKAADARRKARRAARSARSCASRASSSRSPAASRATP